MWTLLTYLCSMICCRSSRSLVHTSLKGDRVYICSFYRRMRRALKNIASGNKSAATFEHISRRTLQQTWTGIQCLPNAIPRILPTADPVPSHLSLLYLLQQMSTHRHSRARERLQARTRDESCQSHSIPTWSSPSNVCGSVTETSSSVKTTVSSSCALNFGVRRMNWASRGVSIVG